MGKCCGTLHGMKPAFFMLGLQFSTAVMNMLFKLAIEDGTNLTVLVTYRLLFATAFVIPLALFLERKTRPKLTRMTLFLAFLTGIFGGFLPLTFFVKSMAITSATFSSAMSNLTPVITFVLSVCFKLETVGLRTAAGKAKVLGTCLSIGGGMMLTFYKGLEITIWKTNVDLLDLFRDEGHAAPKKSENPVLGTLFSLGSGVSFSVWLIVQTKMSKRCPHYSSTAMMCLMASILAVVYTLCSERDWSGWKMSNAIGIITAVYSIKFYVHAMVDPVWAAALACLGIVAFGLGAVVVSWCAKERGPLFVSNFSPLAAIIVAIAANLLVDEKLYLGSFLGGILIIIGLYAMLWGKNKEMKMRRVSDDQPLSPASTQELEDNSTTSSCNNGGTVTITVNGDGDGNGRRNMQST